jgi:hypothetical protein
MTRFAARRPSPAIVISVLALIVALGGSAYAVDKITSQDIAKNAIKSKHIHKKAVKTKHLSKKLAPQATSARPFSAGASDDSLTSLVKAKGFELMGICDTDGDFDPPGLQFDNIGTAFVIYNRGGDNAYSNTEDDDDYSLDNGEGVVFNYHDNTDGGAAMGQNGGFMMVPGWGNLQADEVYDVDSPTASDDYGFPTDCHFAGVAMVG